MLQPFIYADFSCSEACNGYYIEQYGATIILLVTEHAAVESLNN